MGASAPPLGVDGEDDVLTYLNQITMKLIFLRKEKLKDMRNTRNEKKIGSLPVVDYNQLVAKIKVKYEAMKYWSVDSKADAMMKMAYSVVYFGAYDSKGPMALDLRTACCQYMTDAETAEAPAGYPESEFADKIKQIHEKYWKKKK